MNGSTYLADVVSGVHPVSFVNQEDRMNYLRAAVVVKIQDGLLRGGRLRVVLLFGDEIPEVGSTIRVRAEQYRDGQLVFKYPAS